MKAKERLQMEKRKVIQPMGCFGQSISKWAVDEFALHPFNVNKINTTYLLMFIKSIIVPQTNQSPVHFTSPPNQLLLHKINNTTFPNPPNHQHFFCFWASLGQDQYPWPLSTPQSKSVVGGKLECSPKPETWSLNVYNVNPLKECKDPVRTKLTPGI